MKSAMHAAYTPLKNATLSWDVTRACNLSCTHCSNADDRATARKDLPIEAATSLLAEFREAGGSSLHLLGGEPLLRKDILTIIALAQAMNLSVSMTTNGTLLPEAAPLAWLVKALATLTLSLDGHVPEINDLIRGRGTFQRAAKSLLAYRRARDELQAVEPLQGARLNVSHVLCAANVGTIEAMIDCAASLGADEISVTYLKPYGNALTARGPEPAAIPALLDALVVATRRAAQGDIAVTLFEVPQHVQAMLRTGPGGALIRFGGDTYCDTAEGQLRASSDGKVHPCFAATKHASTAGLAAVDTRLIPLREILDSEAYHAFQRASHEALRATPWEVCQACDYFTARTCYPGCPHEPMNVKPQLCALIGVGI